MRRMLMAVALIVSIMAVKGVQTASAEGIGYFPSEVTVTDGLRGQRYTTGSVIINQTADRRYFRLSGTGDIGPWLTFSDEKAPDKTGTEFIAEPNSQLRLNVYVAIPSTTSNGAYKGEILMENYKIEGKQSDFVQAFRQGVSVSVSGTQKLALRIGSPISGDVEVGKILRIQSQVGNESNIEITPSAAVTIQPRTADGTIADQVVGRARADGDKIPAGKEGVVLTSWDTVGQPVGKYRATISISTQGQEFGVRTLDFEIVPAGSLARGGSIAQMQLVGNPPVGTIARVDVTFQNKGQAEATAKFKGEVYLDGAIVSETESKVDATASPGQSAVVSTFFPVNKAGKYTLRGRIQYEGNSTDEAVLEFQVGSTDGGSSMALPIGIGAAAVVALGGGTGFLLRKKRSGKAKA